jgi:hypothetical protein
MNNGGSTPNRQAFAVLRRLARHEAVAPRQERCELCSLPVPPRHRHLLEMSTRQIVCACHACALTFEGAVRARFKAIPRDVRVVEGSRFSDGAWESLALPINVAFVFEKSGSDKRVAMYPSPAGTTEALLTPSGWQALVASLPSLTQMAADVEALLVNRLGSRRDYFIAPVDRCFELAGLIRTHWRGFSGGEAVWRETDNFFDQLRVEARPENPAPEVVHA